jgi:transposase
MGLVEQTLRNWVKAFDAGTLNGAGTPKVSAAAMELSRRRAEVVRLKRENDILRKATAYPSAALRTGFARDAL